MNLPCYHHKYLPMMEGTSTSRVKAVSVSVSLIVRNVQVAYRRIIVSQKNKYLW